MNFRLLSHQTSKADHFLVGKNAEKTFIVGKNTFHKLAGNLVLKRYLLTQVLKDSFIGGNSKTCMVCIVVNFIDY